jgi:Ca2+-binding EF-hand superfamily protein
MTNGARAVYELREAIVKKYGNLIRGWVLLLDRDQSGSVSRQEFIAAVLQILPDDVGEIWRRLDRDKVGSITLSSFAPKSADEVADFKRWSKESFGSLKEALDVMDTDHSGGLSCDEFCSACNKYGFESERLRLIYQSLDIEANGRLNANMIKWLDKWDPPGYLYGDADQPAYARFKEILLGRFKDNAILAWRKGLDKDSSMRVNWAEFQTACRRLKAVSAAQVPGIWRILDTYLCGYVSIDQFDHRAFELLGGFRLWVLKNFGTMIGLMQALDDGKEEDRIISLSLKEFAAGMIEIAERQSLPLTADDVEYLYNGLDLDGQGLISPDELLFLETWEMDIDLNNEADFPQFNLMGAGGSARTGGSIFKRQSFAGGLSRKSTLGGPSTSNGFGAGSSGGFG